MEIVFEDDALREIFETGGTSSRKYKKFCKNPILVSGYIRAVKSMEAIDCVGNLRKLSFLHYEHLKNDSRSSVRIVNGRIERLLFYEDENKIKVTLIEIDDSHYGNKK